MEEEKKVNEADVESVGDQPGDIQIEERVSDEDPKEKKIKNLISLAILLGGLLLGSIFVDLSQLIKGGGISQKILEDMDIFSLDDKTWVAYSDPIVEVQAITDDECETCSVEEALVWLRRILPTVLSVKVDSESEAGRELLEKSGVRSIPAFIFSEEIKDTDFYLQAESLFMEVDGKFVLNTGQIGLPAGKFVDLPIVDESTIKIGSEESQVTVVEYSDFQCPYCKSFHATVKQVIEAYGDQVLYVYKHFPLESIHPQATNAAVASECANDQDKFMEYADRLFATQEDWGAQTGTQRFKTYAAQLGLNQSEFNQCMDEERHIEKVASDFQEGQGFNVSGTPAVFVNDQFKSGAASFDTIKELIDGELGIESGEATIDGVDIIE